MKSPQVAVHEYGGDSGAGRPGSELFKLRGSIRWYIPVIAIYAAAALGLAAYLATCPSAGLATRVLPTGNLPVDSFYSGLALSILLTPIGIVIRKLSEELASLHPFGVAARKHTDLADLERLTAGGFSSLISLFKYDVLAALVQGTLLLAGSTIVPIGTLLAVTGQYAFPHTGMATTGAPTFSVAHDSGNLEYESVILTEGLPSYDISSDTVLRQGASVFEGAMSQQAGYLQVPPSRIGAIPTNNLTYEANVRYDGVLSFSWSSNCSHAPDIIWHSGDGIVNQTQNITFPGGLGGGWDMVSYVESRFGQLGPPNVTVNNATKGLVTYYALVGTVNGTTNLDVARNDPTIEVRGRYWISRVKCAPTFDWELSDCLYDGTAMTDCQPSPGSNTTAIDTKGLDKLFWYMTDLPVALGGQDDDMFGNKPPATALIYDGSTNSGGFRAPLLSDYDKLYGLTAQSIASIPTTGIYGTVQVKTTGSSPAPVYIVRLYILAVVLAIFLICPTLAGALLLRNLLSHTPMRKATFLTIANAVRGPQWDHTLHGGCVIPDSQLPKLYRGIQVMFGVDAWAKKHVGLARTVLPVEKNAWYSGVESNPQSDVVAIRSGDGELRQRRMGPTGSSPGE